MKWRITRLGRIFDPETHGLGLGTHASTPTPRPLDDGLVRFYFACRDAESRSRIAFVDIDVERPSTPIKVAAEPVLGFGPVGYYDDSGVSPGCVVETPGESCRLYYMGWNLGRTVPWRNSIGCAAERQDGRFEPVSPAPVLDRNAHDPFSLSYPWVHRSESGWRMWYGSHSATGQSAADMRHILKTATSSDGLHWTPNSTPALGLSAGEIALTRPSVLRSHDRWHMWFCHRGEAYRIGYAWSGDGVLWHRDDELGSLHPLGEGWEARETCYPAVFSAKGRIYMAYNGDGYGRTGIGLARLEPA